MTRKEFPFLTSTRWLPLFYGNADENQTVWDAVKQNVIDVNVFYMAIYLVL